MSNTVARDCSAIPWIHASVECFAANNKMPSTSRLSEKRWPKPSSHTRCSFLYAGAEARALLADAAIEIDVVATAEAGHGGRRWRMFHGNVRFFFIWKVGDD